ncbi:hypothetical protein MJO28_017882 [Puccinia striiformis f. sp. tritici]|uniref:Carboxylesterase type B domain-containing protein n=2 Tax=Puccinia striiformis f. sp. tritici TaxID=168172 RepID=A0A0L0VNI4_9BASI|nr:hypothetical protein Pst134EA_007454 [Puccinia striiformis f. sp. tritici]KNF00848.1 hypothetical protein PSTG_05982 [Puccinia striiformis f. sp. tritici PST-78]KAH9460402.1 hypothetical protein Pst134EB_008575 [Puccinia striiformis f. sp. tritici]KAH9470189.1 hypothetical protein Pst134EA_007454 [Puccinia striiformis f. sp. tritici]KAI7932990.1 hypothetical protein MJO28_017882 [Puccinia striiformis f. sp. tritici]KAI7963970.1 hypothetical protein MJO29_004397 [Puccinia striiformis f. sp. 
MSEHPSIMVETAYGPVVGFEDSGLPKTESTVNQSQLPKAAIKKFLGVPYARAERWKRAQALKPWNEPLVCQEFGPSLPQIPQTPFDDFYSPPLLARREPRDCEEKGFTVNIFSSADVKEGDKVPVLAWVFGGGLLHGCSRVTMYDPTEWIRREASKGNKFIVVSGNYRTNFLGFLASSDLVEEDPEGLAGNYGAYDCITYLRWVQNNIAKFGGDPDNVTAFGESAGAFILSHLMVCQEKLFRRVILQSGAVNTLSCHSWETHEKNYQGILEKASITAETASERLKALRELPIEQLVTYSSYSVRDVGFALENASSPNAIWSHPCVLSRLREGHWSPHIESVIMGVCKDEGSLFAHMCQTHTPAGYAFSQMELLGGVTHDKFAHLYHNPAQAEIDNPGEGSILDLTQCSGSQPIGDILFKAPTELMLSALDGAKNFESQKPLSIYVYNLEGTAVETNAPGRFFGVAHTVDLILLFNMSHCWAADSESAKVSATLGKTWYDFAKDGCPGLNWPQYQSQLSPYRLVFRQDGGCTIRDDKERSELEKERIKFWATQMDLADFLEPSVIRILDGGSTPDSSEMRSEKTNDSI